MKANEISIVSQPHWRGAGGRDWFIARGRAFVAGPFASEKDAADVARGGVPEVDEYELEAEPCYDEELDSRVVVRARP